MLYRDVYWSLQAGGIRRADGIWSWQWLLLECVCWWLVYPGVPWLLMHPRCAAPPSQSPISLTQARWGCKPAINNTHPPHIPNTKLRLGRIPSLAYSPPPPHPPSKQTGKKNTYRTLNRVTIPTKKNGLFTGFPYLNKNKQPPQPHYLHTSPGSHAHPTLPLRPGDRRPGAAAPAGGGVLRLAGCRGWLDGFGGGPTAGPQR